jgi:HK97 family phage portal protein
MTSLTQIFSIDNPPQEFLKVLQGPYSNDSGINVSTDNALNLSAVGRAVRAIANPIALVSKHIYRKTDGKRERQSNHPAQRLISRKPNVYTKAFDFFNNAQLSVLLWGNFYALIKRDLDFNPVSLVRFPDGVIKPVLIDGDLVYVNRRNGKTYSPDEIFHIKDWSKDGIEGMSRVSQYRQGIGLGLVSEKFQSSFFGKGAHQGGVVYVDEEAGINFGETPEEEEAEMNKIRKMITDPYTGADNFHKVMLLPPGMKFERLTMPLKDAEFLLSRKFQVIEVARMFDTSLSKLFELERATNSNNIEHQGIEFVQEAILPWATNWEQEINDKLLREDQKDDHYSKFNLDSLVRADMKTRYEAHSMSLGQGVGFQSTDEVRALEDRDPIDEDKLFKPMNYNRQSERVANV